MRQRNHKYFIYCILAIFVGGFVLPALTGCSDDPDKAAAKNVRKETTRVLETAVKTGDYAGAKSSMDNVLGNPKNRVKGLAKDSAVLAGGSVKLAYGRQLQSDLGLRTLPIRSTANTFEELLRQTESLLLEKERIAGRKAIANEQPVLGLLDLVDQEVAELKKLLAGDGQTPGLEAQYNSAKAELDTLLKEKKSVTDKRDKVQAVLDDQQSRADALQRKAELTKGQERLDLEKESFAILSERKEYYVQVQDAENKIDVLDSKIELAQMKTDGLKQSIDQSRGRINELNSSQAVAALRTQLGDIEKDMADKQKRMDAIAGDLKVGLKAYRDEVAAVCDAFKSAGEDFNKVKAKDAGFPATLQLAESYHYAALSCASYLTLETDLSIQLQDLLDTADPLVAESYAQKLPIQEEPDAELLKQAYEDFDNAIATYDKALKSAGRLGKDTQSSVLKSQLLAVDGKNRLAERLGQYDVADAMAAKIEELITAGQEYGVSFTKSETAIMLESGIDYTPSLPVNLQVYADDLKKKLSEWKGLKITEQEAAVLTNLQVIEEAVGQHGDELAGQLEPLKQEMLAAQKRGFKETAVSNDPNSGV